MPQSALYGTKPHFFGIVKLLKYVVSIGIGVNITKVRQCRRQVARINYYLLHLSCPWRCSGTRRASGAVRGGAIDRALLLEVIEQLRGFIELLILLMS